MRLVIYISAILTAILFLGFNYTSLPVTITGHLKKNPKDTTAFIENVIIFVKGDNKILAKTSTDKNGDFKVTFTPQKEKSFDFYCTGLGIDTLLIASVKTFKSDSPEMTFYIPEQLKRNVMGKVLCPICKRTDKVYKIRYDDAPVKTRQVSAPRDTNLVGLGKYYCDRDKAKF